MYNYGVSIKSNAYVIVMRMYDCSLRQWVKKRLKIDSSLKKDLPVFLQLFRSVLDIVLLLHEQSVTHYDLKCDNMLLILS